MITITVRLNENQAQVLCRALMAHEDRLAQLVLWSWKVKGHKRRKAEIASTRRLTNKLTYKMAGGA